MKGSEVYRVREPDCPVARIGRVDLSRKDLRLFWADGDFWVTGDSFLYQSSKGYRSFSCPRDSQVYPLSARRALSHDTTERKLHDLESSCVIKSWSLTTFPRGGEASFCGRFFYFKNGKVAFLARAEDGYEIFQGSSYGWYTFAPDSSRLILSRLGSIEVVDLDGEFAGKPIRQPIVDRPAFCTPDVLAAYYPLESVRLYSLAEDRCLDLGIRAPITPRAASPTLLAWLSDEGASFAPLKPNGSPYRKSSAKQLALSPDGAWLALHQENQGTQYVVICRAEDGRAVFRYQTDRFLASMTLCFSPDSRLLAALLGDGVFLVFELKAEKVSPSYPLPAFMIEGDRLLAEAKGRPAPPASPSSSSPTHEKSLDVPPPGPTKPVTPVVDEFADFSIPAWVHNKMRKTFRLKPKEARVIRELVEQNRGVVVRSIDTYRGDEEDYEFRVAFSIASRLDLAWHKTLDPGLVEKLHLEFCGHPKYGTCKRCHYTMPLGGFKKGAICWDCWDG